MAGITADANEAVGSDLGFANPFIYNATGNGMVAGDFTDITSGSNSNGTGPFFTAVAGYDMVTGRGSVKGAAFAAATRPGTSPFRSCSTRRSSRRPTRST